MPINNLRIRVSKKYVGIYKDLTSDKKNLREPIFKQHADVFVLCCILGFRDGKRVPLEKGEQLFFSHYLTNEEETTLKAIAIAEKDKNYQILDDEKALVQIVEEYANRGMEILIENVLSNFIRENEDGYYLQFSENDLLEKGILSFIYQEYNKYPL